MCLNSLDYVMSSVHGRQCAKRHNKDQVPFGLLRETSNIGLTSIMGKSFRLALLWHMQRHDTKISDLVRVTGISRDVINKLLSRENSTTAVENALLISAFYGKTVETFIAKSDLSASERMDALAELLSPDELRLIEAQIQGILQSRGAQP